MLEEKDIKIIKEKACKEIEKLTQRMNQTSEIPKADWESLVLALKAYEKVFNIESMEESGYSGYSRNGYNRDYPERRSRNSYGDDYSGGRYYESRAMDDMMRYADPRDREMMMRYRR